VFSCSQAAEILGARILRKTNDSDDVRAARAVHDSRLVEPCDLFVALAGARTDGHAFLEQAFARGACGALISDPAAAPGNGRNLIVVDDTAEALSLLAGAWRIGSRATFVGITGTCGKTTTRALIAHLLTDEAHLLSAAATAFSSPGNYNTEIGLPLALLAMPRDADVGLFELGTGAPGEIAPLASLLAPQIAVLTMVGRGHLGGFGTVQAVAQEKWELVRALQRNGTAIVNADPPLLHDRAQAYRGNIITVGIDRGDMRGRISNRGHNLVIDVNRPRLHLVTRLLGVHNAANALLAAACALTLGVEPEAIEERIQTFYPFSHRLNLLEAPFGHLLDDTYNANPDSTRAALLTLDNLDLPAKQRAFVFGDMLDLGDNTAGFHREIVELAIELGIGPIFPVGDLACAAAHEAEERGGGDRFVFAEKSNLADRINECLPGKENVLLVKGSHAVGLEALVKQLIEV